MGYLKIYVCSIKYITIEDAINDIIALGKSTMLAKVDIKSAFRLLPVHPVDRHLLGMEWQNNTFIDMCLPFGLRCAPKLFNICNSSTYTLYVLADLLTWIFKQQRMHIVHHYLDDFLMLGPPAWNTCQLASIQHISQLLDIRTSGYGKSRRAFYTVGIKLDTMRMEAHLPVDKLMRIKQMITLCMVRKKEGKYYLLLDYNNIPQKLLSVGAPLYLAECISLLPK